jgi:hypothetical protein
MGWIVFIISVSTSVFAGSEPRGSQSDRSFSRAVYSRGDFRWTDCEDDILHALGEASRPIDFGQYGKRIIVDLAISLPPDLRQGFDLAAMRFTLAQQCETRLVIGGRTMAYQGLAPGIIEEAWWTILFGKKPVGCSGMGGAACAIIARQSSRDLPDLDGLPGTNPSRGSSLYNDRETG